MDTLGISYRTFHLRFGTFGDLDDRASRIKYDTSPAICVLLGRDL